MSDMASLLRVKAFNMSLALFKSTSPVTSGVVIPPQWSYIQSGVKKNISRVMNYHRNAAVAVRGGHILTRLLMSINVPKNLSLQRYHSNVEIDALHYAASQGMGTIGAMPRIFKGLFYSDSDPEMILAVDNYFDAQWVHDNWQHACAVYPLLHGKSDLGMQIPNGRPYSGEHSLSIIVVNVPMLAVQYRAFLYAQMQKPHEFRQGIQRFIGGHVLPNMLPRQMELALMNRVINRYYQIEADNLPYTRHVFALSDYTKFIDEAIDKVLMSMQKGVGRFETLLQNIPSFYHTDIHAALVTPDLMPTRQIDWLVTLSRLKAMSFLADVAESTHALYTNMTHLNQAMQTLDLYNNYQCMQEHLPTGVFFEHSAYIDNLAQAVGKTAYKPR
jgi:hypothetical protein